MVLPAKQLVPVPENVNAADAVSMILSYVTAYQMLTRLAKVKEGSKILMHGAAGAVGSALIQIASILRTCMARHHDWFESDLKKLFALLSENKLKPLVSKTIKLEEAMEAHELIEKGGLKGKLIILMCT